MSIKESTYLITNFSDFTHHSWRVVNDGVMGGISKSNLQLLPNGHILFIGELSGDHNGGFASVKNSHRLNLEQFDTFILRVKGDGKQYSFRFKTSQNENMMNWSYESRFWTLSDQWQTVELPVREFQPVYRGQRLKDIPKPDLSDIREYCLMISNRQEGHFKIEIKSLEAVSKD